MPYVLDSTIVARLSYCYSDPLTDPRAGVAFRHRSDNLARLGRREKRESKQRSKEQLLHHGLFDSPKELPKLGNLGTILGQTVR